MVATRSSVQNDLLLDDVFEEFISEQESQNLPSETLTKYRNTYEKFRSLLGKEVEKCGIIDESSVSKFIDGMSQDGTKAAAVNLHVKDIRVFLFWCMDSDRQYIQPFEIKQQKQAWNTPQRRPGSDA